MTDIALVWDAAQARADITIAPPDLRRDDGLRTAVAISLFTDALARPDDSIPDGTDDRRGWWGDLPPDGEDPDPIGSRLWLLTREKRTEATRLRAEAYAREALAWLVADDVAAAVEVRAAWAGDRGDQLRLVVTVARRSGEATANEVFAMTWNAEAAA